MERGKTIEFEIIGNNLRSIAVVMPSFIGDTILSTTLLQSLACQFLPEKTRIYTIGSSRQLNLLESLPGIFDHCIAPKAPDEKRKLLQKLECGAVFLLRYSLLWALAMKKANIRYRIGFDLERLRMERFDHQWTNLLTHALPSGRFDSPEHQVQLYKSMAERVGLTWNDSICPKIHLTPDDYVRASELLGSIGRPMFIIHITAGSPGKRWPLKHWSTLIRRLKERYDARFIGLGSSLDASHYEHLEQISGIPIHNLCGRTTLRESAALCQFSDLIVTLDTALAHIAAAASAPRLVVLYGPTNIQQWRPMVSEKTRLEQAFVSISCRPCVTRTCYHRSCTRYLTPLRVLNHIEKVIKPEKFPIRNPFSSTSVEERWIEEQSFHAIPIPTDYPLGSWRGFRNE